MARPCDCEKYVVFWCNSLVLAVLALTCSILAISFLAQINSYKELGPEDVCGPPVSLLILGIITFLLSLYSYKVISYSNRKQIILILVCHWIILVVTISIEIWTIIKYFNITEAPLAILESLKESLAKEESFEFWNSTFTELNCCGVFGIEDYAYLNYTDFPETCNNETYVQLDENKHTIQGCAFQVMNYTKSVMLNVFFTILGLIIYEAAILTPLNVHRLRTLKKRILKMKQFESFTVRKSVAGTEQTNCDNATTSQIYHIS